MNKLKPLLRRRFRGLWLSADFRRIWTSLTVTSFGAQITNLALPLTLVDPGPQSTSPQFEFRTMKCQPPRSQE